MDSLVSIIVPAYCVEKYIRRCVNSLILQTYQNIEIVIIDDGSTDLTSSICDEISLEDNRIYVYHQENAGVSAARNYAMSKISGEYVTFVDADDFVHTDYIYKLLETINLYKADIAICREKNLIGNELLDSSVNSQCLVKQIDKSQYDFFSKFGHSIACGTLYSRKCIENLKFDETIYIAEDSLFFVNAFLNASKVVFLDANLYGYFSRNDSATRRKQYDNKKITELIAWEKICNQVDKCYPNSLFSISAHSLLGMNAYKGLKYLKHKVRNNTELWDKCLWVLRKERKYVIKSTVKKHNKLMYSLVCVFPSFGINLYHFMTFFRKYSFLTKQ